MRRAGAILLAMLICIQSQNAYAWGFLGHRTINYYAVFALPPALFGFYKSNINYVSQHAVDPDSRRYLLDEEAPRHYIDCDHYESASPLDTLPHNWYKAVEKYTEDSLKGHGIVPWHVLLVLSKLTKAMEEKDIARVLKLSADIGHYISDAHVPLHTCSNYNGQKTGQEGIHALWETRIPQLFLDSFDTYSGTVGYLENPSDYIWQVVSESYAAVDSVLKFQALSGVIHENDIYSYDVINNKSQLVYAREYCEDYHDLMDRMVEKRMRKSIYSVAAFWYTAWVNAGQPELSGTADPAPDAEEQAAEKARENGKMKGRDEHEK